MELAFNILLSGSRCNENLNLIGVVAVLLRYLHICDSKLKIKSSSPLLPLISLEHLPEVTG